MLNLKYLDLKMGESCATFKMKQLVLKISIIKSSYRRRKISETLKASANVKIFE
ncbi:hypothetical protein WN51_10127 [Melipona quadrifasciata]|uniref:Uncharacterized protein n=1 Tax=Melipona quadrifasciata TaxID=166423 RepID=A0A0N0U324_9HYME|nr:hypothetical protein WN51_10127 [Melipona quadrifasciata]